MRCKLAIIKRPWMIDSDIGRPVALIRRGFIGEQVVMRSGEVSFVGVTTETWLCDSSGTGFPCFIARECLHMIDGDETPEQSIEAMKLLTSITEKV